MHCLNSRAKLRSYLLFTVVISCPTQIRLVFRQVVLFNPKRRLSVLRKQEKPQDSETTPVRGDKARGPSYHCGRSKMAHVAEIRCALRLAARFTGSPALSGADSPEISDSCGPERERLSVGGKRWWLCFLLVGTSVPGPRVVMSV